MTPVSANRVCDLHQICVLCGIPFLDWDDEELEYCDFCSEQDQVDKSPDDPDQDEIERRKAEIRAERPHERIVSSREEELAHRRSLRRALPRQVENSEGALPKKRKPKVNQREMF